MLIAKCCCGRGDESLVQGPASSRRSRDTRRKTPRTSSRTPAGRAAATAKKGTCEVCNEATRRQTCDVSSFPCRLPSRAIESLQPAGPLLICIGGEYTYLILSHPRPWALGGRPSRLGPEPGLSQVRPCVWWSTNAPCPLPEMDEEWSVLHSCMVCVQNT